MNNTIHRFDYASTQSLSQFVLDYITHKDAVKPFYTNFPDSRTAIETAIAAKSSQVIHRQLLHQQIVQQYTTVQPHEKVQRNIDLLLNTNTYTVCTAHQPSIFTGYLYFVYKIIHAAKLADKYAQLLPNNNFVPVFYIGSEDADIDEIGSFTLYENTYKWQPKSTGAVGRIATSEIHDLLQIVLGTINTNTENGKRLYDCFNTAYTQQLTIADATRYIVNELLGQYGVVVIDGDDAILKTVFSTVIQDELLHNTSHQLSSTTQAAIAQNYKVQAGGRDINLFYLDKGIRERIIQQGENFIVNNTTLSFTKEELVKLAKEQPHFFSPNVILRALYQEILLPNISFVGGSGEIAYWLELKSCFDYYKTPFPPLVLRQSFLWVNEKQQQYIKQLGLSYEQIFKSIAVLEKEWVLDKYTTVDFTPLHKLHHDLFAKAHSLAQDIPLPIQQSIDAHAAKSERIQKQLQQKIIRALKQKESVILDKIKHIKLALFPKQSLQERVENCIPYYIAYGDAWLDAIYTSIEPFQHEFIVGELN